VAPVYPANEYPKSSSTWLKFMLSKALGWVESRAGYRLGSSRLEQTDD